MLNPVLYSCKLSTVFESLETVHVIEVVPQIMSFIDMLRELNSFSLKRWFISTANITSVMSLILYFFFRVSLLGKFINNDGSNDISEENFKESPIN